MRQLTRSLVLGLVGVVSMGCASIAAMTQEAAYGSFRRTLTVTEPIGLDVSTGSGSITIRQSGTSQVKISAEIRVWVRRGRSMEEAEALVDRLESEPPIELLGNGLRIGYLDGREFRRSVSINYGQVSKWFGSFADLRGYRTRRGHYGLRRREVERHTGFSDCGNG